MLRKRVKTILFLAEKSIKYWLTKILQKKRNRERLIFFMYDQSELSVSSFKPKFSQRYQFYIDALNFQS